MQVVEIVYVNIFGVQLVAVKSEAEADMAVKVTTKGEAEKVVGAKVAEPQQTVMESEDGVLVEHPEPIPPNLHQPFFSPYLAD